MPLFRKKKAVIHRKKEPQTLDAALEKTLIKRAKQDPEWAQRVALSKFNLNEQEADPIEKMKSQIKGQIYAKVVDKITKDPELAGQFQEMVMAEMFESHNFLPRGNDDEEVYYGGPEDEISRTMHTIRGIRELQKELGGEEKGGGFLKSLFDSEFGSALAAMLVGKIAQPGMVSNPNPIPEVRVLVNVDGVNREVTKSEYIKLSQQGRIAPVGELAAPKKEEDVIVPQQHIANPGQYEIKPEEEQAEQEEQVEQVEEQVEQSIELPEIFQGLDFELLTNYMDETPEEFVEMLKDMVRIEDQSGQFLWGFLGAATPEGVKLLLGTYQNNAEAGEMIKRLLSDEGMVWLTSVIELVKGDVEFAK